MFTKSELRATRREIVNYVLHCIRNKVVYDTNKTTLFFVKRYVRYEELSRYGMTLKAYK